MNVVLPQELYHVTSLDSLYPILESGFLRSRTQTGSDRGFSAEKAGNPDYVYLTTTYYKPLPGKVLLIFDPSILLNRNDYYLNAAWSYDVTPRTFTSAQLGTWLQMPRDMDEILFQNEIPLNPYLRSIVVPQYKPYIMNLILQEEPGTQLPVLDMNRIPAEHRHIINIVY